MFISVEFSSAFRNVLIHCIYRNLISVTTAESIGKCEHLSCLNICLFQGAQWINEGSPLCHITCEDGSIYAVNGCIRGSLVEVNENLIANPQLVVAKVKHETRQQLRLCIIITGSVIVKTLDKASWSLEIQCNGISILVA